ncbi:MAG: hypothetical protein Q9227_000460 [Pyrenula ochraceoflavens]
MDPVSAFSLAGTILQFIDSGSRFLKLAHELYREEANGSDNLSELNKLTTSFQDVLNTFKWSRTKSDNIDGQHGSLAKLANHCQKVVEEMLELLRQLRPYNHPRKRDALKRAFQRIWREEDLKALKSRLDDFQRQFSLHLLASLRQYAMQTLSKQQEILGILGIESRKRSNFEGIATSILKFLASKAIHDVSQVEANLRNDLAAKILEGAHPSNSTAQHVSLESKRRIKLQKMLLSTLKYDGMEEREDRIAETYESTFEWIFRNNRSLSRNWYSLKNWLENDHQIYWITGKAGSGKSTLMKYLCQPILQTQAQGQQEPRCQPYLKEWAGDKELLIASFYFWSSGPKLQMARTGLLRSLLYQLLLAKPDLIADTVPSRWEALSILGISPVNWKELELQSALESVIKAVTVDCRLCLFIDGLDEFAGPHKALLTFVQNLSQNDSVKICVASRPWVEFEEAFEMKPHLRMEDLTYDDIKHYVSSNCRLDPEFPKLQACEPKFANQLIENIISKASGVFLWVHLVVKSLLSGINLGDRVVDLQRRLDYLPPDLEDLYEKILRSLDPFYLKHAAQLVKIMEASENPLSLILFYFADEYDVESVTEMPLNQMSADLMTLHLDRTARRLNSRWKGLLEVDRAVTANTPAQSAEQTVQYLHRTVQDFINSKKIRKYLRSALESPFDPHLSLCIAYCAYIKAFHFSDVAAAQISLCLRHAARVTSREEGGMIRVLDDLASTPPNTYASSDSQKDRWLNENTFMRPRILKAAATHGDIFGSTFLSLVVNHGVTAYVKRRAQEGCLVQKPSTRAEVRTWPLLMDAIVCKDPSFEMIDCLLELKANPNEYVPNPVGATPWEKLLEVTREQCPRIIRSSHDLDGDFWMIFKTMVEHGANVEKAREHYVKTFTNRFGKTEVTGCESFSDEFFNELKRLTIKLPNQVLKERKASRRNLRKWFKGLQVI